jgi:hypothetical protein
MIDAAPTIELGAIREDRGTAPLLLESLFGITFWNHVARGSVRSSCPRSEEILDGEARFGPDQGGEALAAAKGRPLGVSRRTGPA